MNSRKGKSKSFQLVAEDGESSAVKARWSFSPGDLSKLKEEVDLWGVGTESTNPTVPVDSDGESSSVDEFAEEDIPPSPPRPPPQSPPPSSPSERDLRIQDCYKNFREMSLSPTCSAKPRITTIASPVTPYSSPRPSLRKKEYQRKTRSLQDRAAIRESLKSVMDFDD